MKLQDLVFALLVVGLALVPFISISLFLPFKMGMLALFDHFLLNRASKLRVCLESDRTANNARAVKIWGTLSNDF